jgi:hypothetical protein
LKKYNHINNGIMKALKQHLLSQHTAPIDPFSWDLRDADACLIAACMAGDMPSAKSALAGGADIQCASVYGPDTPVIAAVAAAQPDMVAWLFRMGASPACGYMITHMMIHRVTPVEYAIGTGWEETEIIHESDDQPWSPLVSIAGATGHVHLTQVVLRALLKKEKA